MTKVPPPPHARQLPPGARPGQPGGVRRPRRADVGRARGAGAAAHAGGEDQAVAEVEESTEAQELNEAQQVARLGQSRQRGDERGGGQGGGQGRGEAEERLAAQKKLVPDFARPAPPGGLKAEEGKASDGFDASRMRLEAAAATERLSGKKEGPEEPLQKRGGPPRPAGNDPVSALNNSQEPGVFFREDGRDGAELPDPELAEAIEELRRLLADRAGVTGVAAGRDDRDEWIVIVSVEKGVTDRTVALVPAKVRRFKTVLAIPFDALPLKRERVGGIQAL